MALLVKYFGGGKLYPLSVDGSFESAFDYYKERNKKSLNSVIAFEVNTRSMNKSQIIPFFNKYPFSKWRNIKFYNFKLKNNKVLILNTSKELYISNVKNIW